ncbi:Hypothetical protein MVR_LOCUS90 [uncultured virus]|nr:Hypothetical protein MVR_LOCUS90 [uncultured virus]
MDGIETLYGLIELVCDNNHLTHLNQVYLLSRLQWLSYANNQVTLTIKLVRYLVVMRHINCSNNSITDIDFIVRLGSLQSFVCNDNRVSEFCDTINLGSLVTLMMNNNNLAWIEDVHLLESLRNLSLIGNSFLMPQDQLKSACPTLTQVLLD